MIKTAHERTEFFKKFDAILKDINNDSQCKNLIIKLAVDYDFFNDYIIRGKLLFSDTGFDPVNSFFYKTKVLVEKDFFTIVGLSVHINGDMYHLWNSDKLLKEHPNLFNLVNNYLKLRNLVDDFLPENKRLHSTDIKAAIKNDDGKPRMDLLPIEPLLGAGDGFAYGAKKYSDRNWEKGFDYGRLYAAILRHLFKWWGGEELDKESGVSHLSHALSNLMMLHATHTRGIGRDDRK
jgi:hypothetical protein